MSSQVAPPDPAIARAICYMERNLGQQIRLHDLAGLASYSKYHFVRRFYACTGETPVRYLAACRIGRAAESLSQPQLCPVRDVAAEVGYSSLSTFTRKFHRLVGLTPGAFRSFLAGGSPSELAPAVARGDRHILRGRLEGSLSQHECELVVAAYPVGRTAGKPLGYVWVEPTQTQFEMTLYGAREATLLVYRTCSRGFPVPISDVRVVACDDVESVLFPKFPGPQLPMLWALPGGPVRPLDPRRPSAAH